MNMSSVSSIILDKCTKMRGAMVYSQPAYETIVKGGGALQGSWLPKNLTIQDGQFPHGSTIANNWESKELRDRILRTINHACAMLLGTTVKHFPEERFDEFAGYRKKMEKKPLSAEEIEEARLRKNETARERHRDHSKKLEEL